MADEPADDSFHDCELGPEVIFRTRSFNNVLFTGETETPVNELTGETSAHSQATVDEAPEFASSINTNTPQIALPASVKTQIEIQSKPYTAAAFFHFKSTGSLELHRAYHAAYESDSFVNLLLRFLDLDDVRWVDRAFRLRQRPETGTS